VGFTTSPGCGPQQPVAAAGRARILTFTKRGQPQAARDLEYPQSASSEIVAPGEALPGPGGTLAFRLQSVSLTPDGTKSSPSAIVLLNEKLEEAGRVERFLLQSTFASRTLVFSAPNNQYSLFAGAPPRETQSWQQDLPIDARSRDFGETGVAFSRCQQELQPNQYASSRVIHAGAQLRCSVNFQSYEGWQWEIPLRDGQTVLVLGQPAQGGFLGRLHTPQDQSERLILWRQNRPPEELPWPTRAGCFEMISSTATASRYIALESESCSSDARLLSSLGAGAPPAASRRLFVFDRSSGTPLVDRQFPSNGRVALSPDGARLASFEAGELRIYELPQPAGPQSGR